MDIKGIFLSGNIMVDPQAAAAFQAIAPVAPPTSARIKDLLGRGLVKPETLTPDEVQELCGSVVYHLLAERFG